MLLGSLGTTKRLSATHSGLSSHWPQTVTPSASKRITTSAICRQPQQAADGKENAQDLFHNSSFLHRWVKNRGVLWARPVRWSNCGY